MNKKLTKLSVLTAGVLSVSPTFADELPVDIGGHIRVNYGHLDWQEAEIRDGFSFESLRLNLSGELDNFSYKAEYRWYENVDFDTVRYADLTYTFDEELDVTAGITKVPFGLLPFASNSFWFSVNYYLGFEDDYDAGITTNYTRGNWDFHLGYFLNDEYNDASTYGRYTFDVADDGEYRNKEDGQYNLRANYTANFFSGSTTDLGASFQYGDILNLDTLENGDMKAYALHLRHLQGPVKVELQYIDFDYNLEAPEGQLRDRIALSSFNAPFLQVAEGASYMANLVYSVPMKFKTITDLTCYTEYSRVEGDVDAQKASSQWVNGCSFGWDKLFVYVDSIQGRNMWFSGGPGIGLDLGGLQDTTHRLNISLGIYF
ncbi:porin [Salinimonas chungwhensis]|uniref:porin n=1 Tax=Salinimonas chungwhensis TaxID=265425 RepID=UPI00036D46C3|nr:porin [Salinimonas chungwhensis]